MGENSKIAWTHHTYNPWWGCEKVSPGCANCYAEAFANRYGKWFGPDNPRRMLSSSNRAQPLRWNEKAHAAGIPARVFCGSMCDVCEDRAELLEPRADLMRLIERTENLTWLLLTKRPENLVTMFGRRWSAGWPDNIWLGVTAENQEQADRRIPILRQVPAAKRFLSCEPLLGPITFRPTAATPADMLRLMEPGPTGKPLGAIPLMLDGIDWVICGGESGHGARPMQADWVRALRDQCVEARVPFFFKQWGAWEPDANGVMVRQRDQHAPGNIDGSEWMEVPG